MSETRSSSAMFKRAEQLKKWEQSDTNKQSQAPKPASRIRFASGIVFLAACTSGDKEEVQRLLKMGADINTANVDGLTALHQACIDDNLEMVEFLVSRGADVNRGDNEGWTPLHATASCGFLSIARYLLENGADVAAVNYDRELPVDIAESDVMESLLQNAISDKGVDCEKSRNAELLMLLKDAKNWAANGYVEVLDPKTGGTPLHVAAAKGYTEVAKILLDDCGVDPDSVDYEGWSALHAAALWGQKDAAALLLKYGADPDLKNYSGQTCKDLVDPSISSWLDGVTLKAPKRIKNNNNINNNNNKRKLSPPRQEVKRLTTPTENIVKNDTDKEKVAPKTIIKKVQSEGKPPKGRAASPEASEPAVDSNNDEPPSWRRSASFRTRPTDTSRENKPLTANNNTQENDPLLRRTHSFENDKSFYQRYRDVTARIKASSCPSIPPVPPPPPPPPDLQLRNKNTNNTRDTNEEAHHRVSPTPERRENTWSSPTNTNNANNTAHTTVRSSMESLESTNSTNSTNSTGATTPTKLSPGNIFKNFFKSFVPPVRDEESETQRKAHAKRVRETRRSTQGVTLDEIKSAEQFVKKKTGNGTAADTDSAPPSLTKKTDEPQPITNADSSPTVGAISSALASATATATIAATSERRPSWRLRLDPGNKLQFELEDAGGRPASADATVTLPLRRATAATAATTAAATVATTVAAAAAVQPSPASDDRASSTTPVEEERERESSTESKSSSASPASTQAALNVIQRRRRPKRRSTGVGHVDMDDIVNDRGGGGEGDGDNEQVQSGSERTVDDGAPESERDYKALYEEAMVEVKRLRNLLTTSRATITKLTEVNQNSISEKEKREKRAMERKLSEMEEELKFQQVLHAENQRLKDENGALIRVISKLSK